MGYCCVLGNLERYATSMGYTLGTAAKATGKSRTTILRAIEKGKITAAKNEHGQWDIDPSELHRVYPPKEKDTVPDNSTHATPANTNLVVENKELQVKLDAAEQRAKDAMDQVHDLRSRLDQSEEERRKKDAQLTVLLTDQSPRPAPQEPSGGRLSRAWSILRGKG